MASYLSNWDNSFSNPVTQGVFTDFKNNLLDAVQWVYDSPAIDTQSLLRTSTTASGSFVGGGSFEMTGSGFLTAIWTVKNLIVHDSTWDYSFAGSVTVNAITKASSGFVNHIVIDPPSGGNVDIYGKSSSGSQDASISRITYQADNGVIELKGALIYHGLTKTITGTLTSLRYTETNGHDYQLTGLSYTLEKFDTYTDLNAFVLDMMKGNDLINGTAGNDVLRGFAGNDTLNGGKGADTMIGGADDDTYLIDNPDDKIIEDTGEGRDTARINIASAGGTYVLGANVENAVLINTLAVKVTGNELDNELTGNAAANTLEGGAGNDKLDGGKGADTMKGGAGDDSYIVDHAGDVVDETDGSGGDAGGTDEVQSKISFTLGGLAANAENLTLLGTASINGTGNALANHIAGNKGANILDGGEGDDLLEGNAGNDTYIVDSAGDQVTETLAGTAGGVDLVKSSVDFTLGANLENLLLIGNADIDGSGNALANTLTGNDGSNDLWGDDGRDILIGGAGNDFLDGINGGVDTLKGGAGDDWYYVSVIKSGTTAKLEDIVGEATNQGADTLLLYSEDSENNPLDLGLAAAGTIILPSNFENLNASFTYSNKLNFTGNTLANNILGNDADNIIDGGLGADILSGGSGNDSYIVDNSGDQILENADEGIDTVKVKFAKASQTYTLGDNLENAGLINAIAFNLTGNTLGNILTGNAAANILRGEQGDDIVNGGGGNDTLYGGDGGDELNGGTGADKMEGGLGDDVYFVDNAADIVDETGDALGTDEVRASINYTLGDNLENLTLIGKAALKGTGNALDNFITASDTGNILDGGQGDDTLLGGLGRDVLIGGDGTDSLNGGEGNDIYLFTSYQEHTEAEISDAAGIADEVRFASTIDGDQLFLFGGDTGIERVVIGTGTAAVANTSGNTALDITASDFGNALTIIGNAGNNQLFGTGFDDVISGGAGDDMLYGEAGNDQLTGGGGKDIFFIDFTDNTPNSDDADTITDFVHGTDLIYLSPDWAGNLSHGLDFSLGADAFIGGTQAATPTQMIIYDSVSGSLYYDGDGNGTDIAPIQIAIIGLGSHPTLSSSDFRVDWP